MLRTRSSTELLMGAFVALSAISAISVIAPPANALSCSRSDRLLFPQAVPSNGRIIVRSFGPQKAADLRKRVSFVLPAQQHGVLDYTVAPLFPGNTRFHVLTPKRHLKTGTTLSVKGGPTATLQVTKPLLPPTKDLQLRGIRPTGATQKQTMWGYTWSRSFDVTFDRTTAAKARNVHFDNLVALVAVMEEHPVHGRRWTRTAVPVVGGAFSVGRGLCEGTFNVSRWVLTGRDPKVPEVAAKVTIIDRVGHRLGRAQVIFPLPPPLAKSAVTLDAPATP